MSEIEYDDTWRLTATAITKYDPSYRDENGYYVGEDWTSISDIGESFNGKILTFDRYKEIEERYVVAARWFFEFHGCKRMIVRNLEKRFDDSYKYADKNELLDVYNKLAEGTVFDFTILATIVKLFLRELAWAELICQTNENSAVRFGYDYYMYFNSDKDMRSLFENIRKTGLFVGRKEA